MPEYRTVYVIDDDEPVRDSVALLLEASALAVQSFASGPEFLDAASSLAPGCVVTDMRMPVMDGIELLRRLSENNLHFPVIVMTAHGEVSLAVQALKAGARDFIEKPFPGGVLIDAVLSALQTVDRMHLRDADVAGIEGRIASLTAREREVMDQLVAGNQNKIIAYNLGMSPRTVEVHRARVMEKMQARSLSALVRMVVAAGQDPLIKTGQP
jgi:two-component system, LuxR family, response regulator FixJ